MTPAVPCRIVRIAILLVGTAGVVTATAIGGGCVPGRHRPGASSPGVSTPRSKVEVDGQAIEESLRRRAETVFDKACFFKPLPDGLNRDDVALLPLIVQQAKKGPDGRWTCDAFGEVSTGADGGARVDMSQPAVYFFRGSLRIRGRVHDTLIYAWVYGGEADGAHSSAGAEGGTGVRRIQAVRVILGSDGFPAVWEVFHDSSGASPVYVSESVDQASAAEYGGVIAGRRFAVERGPDANAAGGAVLVRVLADGPVPMGPFVYVAAGSLDVSTLLCRCMPSQMEETIRDGGYVVRPLERLIDALGDEAGDLGEWMWDSVRGGARIEDRLRLPAGF